MKRSGETFFADVIVQDVIFGGRRASVVLALDRSDRGHTQVLLREREQLFSALVEHAPDIIARIDRELRHVYVNPAVFPATWVRPEELIGKTNCQLGVPLELCMRWAAGVRRVFASGRQQEIEITFPASDGQRYYESRMVPEFGGDGHVESVLAIARDITERKCAELALRASEGKLRRSQHEFETLADALPHTISCYDRELKHTYVNAALERATGLSRPALIGRSNAEAGVPSHLVNLWDETLRRVFDTGQPAGLEFEYETSSGARDYEARYVPMRGEEGTVESVLCVAYDITERKRAEQERLASMARQRDAFVREVHHRVKNNLQGVVGLLRQLANTDASLEPMLAKAISQLQAMAIVHAQQGRELREGVAIDGMVADIARSVERSTGVHVLYDGNATPDAALHLHENQAVAIALVLNELIMNAAKHGSDNSTSATISVTSKVNAQHAVVAVANRGILPPGFDFAQGNGLGTGLELVKALVPGDGASVAFSRTNGRVKAVLELNEPVLVSHADRLSVKRDEWDRRKRTYSDRRR